MVDEWGAWHGPLRGINPAFLVQQNSLRDAVLASLNLNVFARHAARVRMANIAQMINVLQAMILTDKEKKVVTPTYYATKCTFEHPNSVVPKPISARINGGRVALTVEPKSVTVISLEL